MRKVFPIFTSSPNWGNPAEGEFWQWLEEKTNVHIEWVTYLESEATEKFKLLMASGEYPDAFMAQKQELWAEVTTISSAWK